MKFLLEWLSNNVGLFYLLLYIVTLVLGAILYMIVHKLEKIPVFLSNKEYNRFESDICKAESFGNEPLSELDCYEVVNTASIQREVSEIRLIDSLINGEDLTYDYVI